MTEYVYVTEFTSRNYTPGPRVPKGITIHHWGGMGQKFANVVSWLCQYRRPGTSAHYIAQGVDENRNPDPRVACIVDPEDIAWHAGDWAGNVSDIGIECRPEATDADYAVVALLVHRLRSVYGNLPLKPHSYWANTACPGRWDLTRLDKMARAITDNSTTDTTGEDDMSDAQYAELLAAIKAVPAKTWDNILTGHDEDPGDKTPAPTAPARSWLVMARRDAGRAYWNTDTLEGTNALLRKSIAELDTKAQAALDAIEQGQATPDVAAIEAFRTALASFRLELAPVSSEAEPVDEPEGTA